MESKKSIFFWIVIPLLSTCAAPNSFHHNFASIPALEEQCKILNKKRESVKIKKSRHGLRKFRNAQRQALESLTNSNPEMLISNSPTSSTFLMDTLFIESAVTETQTLAAQHNVSDGDANEALQILTQNDAPEANRNIIQQSPSIIAEKETFNQPGIENNVIPALAGACGIVSIALLGAFRKQSKQISYWAAKNPWKTRGLITATHLVTAGSMLALGHQFSIDGHVISEAVKYIAISTAATAVCIYPLASSSNYLRRKTHDVVLYTSGAAMMLYAGNHYDVTHQQNPSHAIYSFASNTETSGWHVVEKQITTPKIKKQEEPKKKAPSNKGGLVFLAILAFVALGYGIAALSCSLSCSGHEAMAGLVGIGGLIGLIVGFVAVIRAIFGKSGKKKKPKAEAEAVTL
jgi:hypothetical protein